MTISIHALRGEGDKAQWIYGDIVQIISIHALRGEGDRYIPWSSPVPGKFQSTPSVGRATAKIYKYTILRLYTVHIKLYIFATAVLFT